ncbi:MAG TPA: hypothetical protein VMA09_05530 [Candidatus Binataceae bacterium]|nr:hypothetical protein [Candidatus Binataceae bacterium]
MAIFSALALAFVPIGAAAQYQYDVPRPAPSPALPGFQGGNTLERPPAGQGGNILELAPAQGAKLPPAPAPLTNIEIPSAFVGCWEGTPDGFDSVVNSRDGFTIGQPGRIVFCYRPNRIDVPVATLNLGKNGWLKDIALNYGLGLTVLKVDEARIESKVYAVTPTQIHARTFVPLKGVELMLWVVPIPFHQTLTDEEIATLKDTNTVSVTARQQLVLGSGFESLRTWHADFHRVPDPSSAPR